MSYLKPKVGYPISTLTFPNIDGSGDITVGKPKDRWTILIVYRGKHCPRCKKYLNKLNAMLDQWTAVLDVVVVSGDPKEKAEADLAEFGWNFTMGYGLTEAQMQSLGLYISDPISEAETDRRFAEPGAFVLKSDGSLMLVDISNGPAARPDLEELLDGVTFNITNDRPTRGLV